jgi:non-specific protein-tyrosine kinase
MLQRWWWLLVAAPLVAGLVSFITLRSTPPSYLATTTLMVGETFRSAKPGGDDIPTAQRLAGTYAEMGRRQPVLEAAARSLDPPASWQALREQVLLVHYEGSQTIEIRATDADPKRARDIAAAVAQQLIAASPTASAQQEVAQRRQFIRQELDTLQSRIQAAREELDKKRAALAKETSARALLDRQDEIKALELNLDSWRSSYTTLMTALDERSGPNTIAVIEPASLPTAPSGRGLLWSMALAAAAGLLLAVGGVLLIEYVDDTVQTKEDLERLVGAPTLGLLARLPSLQQGRRELLVLTEPASPAAEAFRLFSANLRFTTLGEAAPILLITSPGEGEGKSTTAAHLAAALAQTGKRVLLADLDLRKPTLHLFFGLENQRGATTLLLEPATPLEACLVETAVPGLAVLPSGPIPPNPSELLSRFGERLVERLRGQADYVILDTPPLLAVADTVILARLVDSRLLVAWAGRTRRQACRAAREALARVEAAPLGAFLNAAPERTSLYGYRYAEQRPGPIARLLAWRRKPGQARSSLQGPSGT